MDFQASVDRVEQELLRLGEHGLDTATWCRAADGLLDRLVGFDGSCWHTIDPATVLITSHLTLNLPGRFPLLAANEYLAEDVNKFADLAAAPQKVGVLSQATGGQPQRSQRWQEMLRPNSFDAELRVALVDSTGCWGSLILVRDRGRPDFDPETMVAVERLAGTLVNGLRGTLVAAYGLSGREQAVTALVLQGRSTRQIARALSISPYTVQEHLTAVFDKVGVRSRGELVGQVFFRHCLPAIPD